MAPDAPDHHPRSRRGSTEGIDQRPRVVVLAERWPVGGPSWTHRDAESVVIRGVAAALTPSADVHVIIPEGESGTTVVDGAFTVHSLGNDLDPSVTLRRIFLMETLLSSSESAPLTGAVLARIKEWLGDCRSVWEGGRGVMSSIEPDVVMIAGHFHGGLETVLEPDAPFVALPLCVQPKGRDLNIFEPDVSSASAIVTTSEAERARCRLPGRPRRSLGVQHRPARPREPECASRASLRASRTRLRARPVPVGSRRRHSSRRAGPAARLAIPPNTSWPWSTTTRWSCGADARPNGSNP